MWHKFIIFVLSALMVLQQCHAAPSERPKDDAEMLPTNFYYGSSPRGVDPITPNFGYTPPVQNDVVYINGRPYIRTPFTFDYPSTGVYPIGTPTIITTPTFGVPDYVIG